MNSDTATSVEQSKRLLESGIDPATASRLQGDEETPAWTFNDLVKLMPKKIEYHELLVYVLTIYPDKIVYELEHYRENCYLFMEQLNPNNKETMVDVAIRIIETLKDKLQPQEEIQRIFNSDKLMSSLIIAHAMGIK